MGERATLLTFVPPFPTRPGPCDPMIRITGFPLLGLSKDRPSIDVPRRVHFPHPDALAPFGEGEGCHTLPRSAPVVSHHLDGLLLFELAGLFHPAADPGFATFRPVRENQLPRNAILPFEAFPPPTARPVSPPRLPSRPFSPLARSRDLRALLHRRVRCAFRRCRRTHPLLPWAWLISLRSALHLIPRRTGLRGGAAPKRTSSTFKTFEP